MLKNKDKKIDELISFCKEKGFIFQSSEIYGGLAGAYDFGPNGVELLNNIKKFWWKEMVQKKSDYFGLDSAIFKDAKVWEASGHTTSFSDPMAECKKCNSRIRVDKILNEIGIFADEKMSEEKINQLFNENKKKIICPNCQEQNFSKVKNFNLMIKTNYGQFTGNKESEKNSESIFLPPEACQGIYLNFKNIVDSIHPKFPFGIAQIGKAFRNEISPRNFIFRTREFEQADTQFFIKPNENKEPYEQIKKDRMQWHLDLGLSKENLKWHQHENLVFYAQDAWDIEYNFPDYGFDEIEGVHDRTDYDLTQHIKFSGKDLSYLGIDHTGKSEKFIPWVLETSLGLGRVFLAVISEAYDKEKLEGDTERIVLRLKPFLAPIKIAIFPLVKKDGLPEIAQKVFKELSEKYNCQYSETASIGKRYRKADEIGIPFCITIDYQTKEDDFITIRERDTMQQEKIKISDLKNYFSKIF